MKKKPAALAKILFELISYSNRLIIKTTPINCNTILYFHYTQKYTRNL